MLRSSRLLGACAFLVGILLGASVCGADGPPAPPAPPAVALPPVAVAPQSVDSLGDEGP